MEDYKQEIKDTRIGCLGSSDGKMISHIAHYGYVPKSAQKRLAVVKGLTPNEEIPRTAAVIAGDVIEQAIYDHLAASNPNYKSNPRWESKRFSRKNVKLISHPDIVLEDSDSKTIFAYEVKTTKRNVLSTKSEYSNQLFIHWLLGRERANELGRGWKLRLFLAHYSTDGLDLDNGVEFDPDRLTLSECKMRALFDMGKAMDIIDAYLEDFNEYFAEEVDAEYLPVSVRDEFKAISDVMREIKEKEDYLDGFKKRLYDFLVEKDIKSIKSDEFIITRVDDSVSHTFDGKKYLEDLAAIHPLKAKWAQVKYDKATKRKGFAKITLKKEKV